MILDMIARLPVLTGVDGSMIPLEDLDDTTKDAKVGTGPIVLIFGCEPFLQWSRVYIYTLDIT